MNSTKLIAFIILGITMIGMTIADSPVYTCSGLTTMPTNSTECTSFNNKTTGDDCCYIAALRGETKDNETVFTTVSACFWKPVAVNETAVAEAAKALGDNSTYTCGSFFVAISSMVAFIFAFLF